MEIKNSLGFYIKPDAATVVSLVKREQGFDFVDCVKVIPEFEPDKPPQTMGQALIVACMQKQLVLSDPHIALNCGSYNQHNVHSQFADIRKISQTIRFDAEEAIATDASDLAISFNVINSDQTGSDVTVFSASRKVLSDILIDMQNNNFDPAVMEPDIAALARFINHTKIGVDNTPVLYAIIARNHGYLFTLSGKSGFQSRTFVIRNNSQVGELLGREIPLTIASLYGGDEISRIELFDGQQQVDTVKLTERTRLEVRQFELLNSTQTAWAQDCDPVDFAIAYGSALAVVEKSHVDFRQDFSPYQGRRMMFEKTLKVLSVSVTVMLLSLGLFFQMRLYVNNNYVQKLRDNFEAQYSSVMLGKKFTSEEPLNRLKRELTQIRQVKEGQLSASGQASVPVMLANLIQTLNDAGNVSINIETISIGGKNIVLTGDTASRQNTLDLFSAIDKNIALKVSQYAYDLKAGRDNFRVTIIPK